MLCKLRTTLVWLRGGFTVDTGAGAARDIRESAEQRQKEGASRLDTSRDLEMYNRYL